MPEKTARERTTGRTPKAGRGVEVKRTFLYLLEKESQSSRQ
jgi:hypothetical protein